MRKIDLYIDGKRVDLDDESFILMNHTMEDLSNPTAVKNSFSQTITLKGTPNNNRIFGDIARADRKTVRSSSSQSGVNFDPRRKTPFTVFSGSSEVLESGYCKLEAVKDDHGLVTYEVSLYGGLGSFFYSLSYDEDGNALTLADLIYKDADDRDVSAFPIRCSPQDVSDAWSYLNDGTVGLYSWWNILNFCPAYNGLPSDFDTKHAIIGNNWKNAPSTQTKDGVTYTYKSGLSRSLCAFTNPRTEWEVCDLRWYLQRPAMSLFSLFNAICDPRNNGGFSVDLDASFFNEDNHLYHHGWVTLPMIATEDRANQSCLDNVLRGSKTPAAYLFGFAKMFGLVFTWDNATRQISLMTRQTFYAKYVLDTPIDLSDRVDREGRSSEPSVATARWYQFGGGCIGETADLYKRNFGRDYGIAKCDTGYDFDNDTNELTKDIVFVDALEAQERDLLFCSQAIQPDGQGGWEDYLAIPRLEAVTYQLWNGDETEDFDILCPFPESYPDNPDMEFADWLPKLQFHNSDNKSVDGANVLCVFEGMRDAPIYATSPTTRGKEYFLTADSAAMTDLLGSPCWDMSCTGISVISLPSFRRHHLEGNYIVETYEWGKPLARPVLDVDFPADNDTTIFSRFWKDYFADRYDVDGRAWTVKVNLRGLQVGQDLMRRFFWYGGATWVLNRIVNHSLATDDLTECEFVKVKDINAYLLGATTPDTQYLNVTPSTLSQSVTADGGTAVFSLSSSSPWRVYTFTPGLVFNRDEGGSGILRLEVTMGANPSSSMRTANVVVENEDGISVTLTIVQAGASIVDNREITFNTFSQNVAKASGSFYADLTCTAGMSPSDVTATANVSWISGLSVSQIDSTTLRVSGSVSANSDIARTGIVTATITGTNKYTQHSVIQAQGEVSSFYVRPEVATTVPYLANIQTIEIGAVTNWTAQITTDQTGGADLDVTSGGAGKNFINLSIPRNSTSSTRTINVRVSSGGSTKYVSFSQSANGGSSAYITPSKTSVTLSSKSGQSSTVTINASATWEIYEHPSWATASANGYGSGSKTLTITTASANYGTTTPRSGVIKVRLTGDHSVSNTIQLTQTAAYVLPATGNATLAKNGTSYSIPVTASGTWGVVSSSQSWLTATKSGNDLVLSATTNTSGSARNASVVIALTGDSLCNTTVNVTQLATEGQGDDDIEVGLSEMSFIPSGESHDLMVYATGAWTITSKPNWITPHYTSQSGSQSGERVTLEASANTDSDRTGTVVFTLTGTSKTASVDVSQDVTAEFVLDDDAVTVDYKAQTLNVSFDSNCQWRVLSYTSGMVTPPQVAEGTGDGSLAFAVSINPNLTDRVGQIVFGYGEGYASRATLSLTQTHASISLSETSGSFDPDGETKILTLTSSGAWEVYQRTGWLSVRANTTDGTSLIYIDGAENPMVLAREGFIVFRVTGTQVTCQYNASQAEAVAHLTVSQTTWELDHHAHQGVQFNIFSNTDWEVTGIHGGVTFNLDLGNGNTTNAFNVPFNSDNFPNFYSATLQTLDGEITIELTIQQSANPITPEE